MAGESQLRLVSIYPTLLGTYGDGGNLRVLAARARARGYEVEAIELDAGAPVPETADLYVLGGGEDDAQVAAARALRADGGLARAAGSRRGHRRGLRRLPVARVRSSLAPAECPNPVSASST